MLIQPSRSDWQMLVAGCLRRAGHREAALRMYEELHRRFPDHLDCLRFLAWLYSELNRDSEAHRYADKLRRAEKAALLVFATSGQSNLT